MKYFRIYIICLLLAASLAFPMETRAQVYIYNYNFPRDTLIDMGMVTTQNKLFTNFAVSNKTSRTLRIAKSEPSFFLGQSPGHGNEWEEFKDSINWHAQNFLDLLPNTTLEIKVTYIPNPILVTFPPGKKEALLKIGVYDPELVQTPSKVSDFVLYKEFILHARKTIKYIQGYDDEINFDSVYINPEQIISKPWIVHNPTTVNVTIDEQVFDMLTNIESDSEFVVENKLPLNFKSGNVLSWIINYKPLDSGTDSARLKLIYHPEPGLYPDSVDYTEVKIVGTGVEQKMDLWSVTNAEIQIDSLVSGERVWAVDFGKVWAGETEECEITMKNNGSLPFSPADQEILDEEKNQESETFNLSFEFLKFSGVLDPNKSSNLKIRFTPLENQKYRARYIIYSDIMQRDIQAVPASAEKIVILIKGEGIQPVLTTDTDSLNFENVVISADCPKQRSKTFTVRNTGNAELHVPVIKVEPELTTPFVVIPREMELLPDSSQEITVSFSSKDQTNIGEYKAELVFISNANPPYDTVKIDLLANGISPPVTLVSLPELLKAKPGRLIDIPIMVEGEKIAVAKSFTDTIFYDRSLMRYSSYELIGTASENAGPFDLREDWTEGKLFVDIQNFFGGSFLERDTLIILKFNTYLGDKIRTSVEFADPMIGDGDCARAFSTDIRNGSFQIDSVCGLEFKTFPANNGQFEISRISPNPASEKFEIEYQLAFNNKVSIRIYNAYGTEIAKIVDRILPAGRYKADFYTDNLIPGFYYCEMQSGNFKQVQKICIIK